MVRFTIHIFFIVPQLILLLLLSAEENIQNQPCSTPFLCGKLGWLTFPFNDNSQPLCGLYPINCTGPTPKIQLRKGGYWFQILNISQTNSIFINDTDLLPKMNSKNCESFASLALPDNSIVSNVSTSDSLTIFNCSSYDTNSSAYVTCGDYELYYNNTIKTSPPRCSIVRLPTSRLDISTNPRCYSCLLKGSQCVSDERNGIKCSGVSKGDKKKLGLKLGLGIGCLIFVSCPLIFLIWRSYKKVQSSSDTIFGVSKGTIGAKFMPNRREIQKHMEAYLSKYGPLPVRRYSYVNLKKMTNNFTTKLGQGGYGDVYKGKLENGCLVAVKMLNESKGNGEEFMNEVSTISRTSHVNIVSLLGFCFEGSKRALIYEFMPNGSLEKFIFDGNSQNNNNNNNDNNDPKLEWEVLYQIALGIARGLEYLHRGCSTRILHFDIKPHNILLDKNLSPKISDFGLAKICTREESIVSILGTRGTAGYIAPEVFSRHFGGVSHKSDVYSYGMMVFEMVGGRRNINVKVDRTSEIYFPDWIYKRLELGQELGLSRILNEDENERAKKMITVSLWCIQTNPSNRPAIGKVIDMLEGSLESLQLPPKPVLSTTLRESADTDSTTLLSY